MKAYSFSDLSRRSGDVLDSALAGPVSLVKRGRPKVVMLPVAEYERLLAKAHVTAYTLDTAPQHVIDELVAGFEEIVANDDRMPD